MNEGELRDQLAVERTRLANERTLLAYIRTALALAAAGAAVLQFLPDHPSLLSIAWLLITGGCTTMVIGTYRFFSVRRQLKATARILAFAILLVVAGCAARLPAATPAASPNDLLGTWRMDSMTEGTTGKRRGIADPAFMQFYEDGSVASWSAAGMGEVAHGRYRIREGRLSLTPLGSKGLPFGVTGDTWWYEKENGDRCLYRRVRPDLLPGRVP